MLQPLTQKVRSALGLFIIGLLALPIISGCNGPTETSPVAQAPSERGKADNCMTTGPDSPIVTGENSVVVINGKTHVPGPSAGCDPSSSNVSTYGAGSPIVTGAGAKVTIKIDR